MIFGWFDIAVPFRDLIFIPVGVSQGDKADQDTFSGRILKKQVFFRNAVSLIDPEKPYWAYQPLSRIGH